MKENPIQNALHALATVSAELEVYGENARALPPARMLELGKMCHEAANTLTKAMGAARRILENGTSE